jgi:hypothetical protein
MSISRSRSVSGGKISNRRSANRLPNANRGRTVSAAPTHAMKARAVNKPTSSSTAADDGTAGAFTLGKVRNKLVILRNG